MTQKRELRPVLTKDLTEAIEQVIVDAQDAGVDLEDIDDSPRLEGRLRQDDNSLNELVSLKSQGSDIPGQSLVNSTEQKYPWESPPEFSNPRVAVKEILNVLLEPEAVKSTVKALSEGASVGDLAMAVTYANFVEGKINPDVMLLTMEPVMYLIMAIGEEANIKYNIDGDDIDEPDEIEVQQKLNELDNVFKQIKGDMSKRDIKPENLKEGVVDNSLLQKVQEAGPEIRENLLDRRT
tara:strand:- start:51 stop:761 length:711 start_codon:yes stop_codon:yes gene_type:complete